MKTFKQSIFKHPLVVACLFFFFSGFVSTAGAAGTTTGLASIGSRVDEISKAGYKSGKLIAGMVGIAFVISGFMQMKGAKQNNSGYGQPLITLIVGVLLLSIIGFVNMSTETTFGSNKVVQSETLLK